MTCNVTLNSMWVVGLNTLEKEDRRYDFILNLRLERI